MNGEGPSVPITTLAGIQSLTDLLLELPLPTPLPGTTGTQRSLLPHDAEEAQRLLAGPHDNFLIQPLLDVLNRTSLDQVEVKEGYCGRNAHCGQTSQLLQVLLNRNPGIFGGLIPVQTPQPSPSAANASVPQAQVAGTSNPTTQPGQSATPGSSPWMQTQFSPNAIYSQPASSSSFSASHLSSCSPHSNSPQFPTQESPSYFDQCGPQSVGGSAAPVNSNICMGNPGTPGASATSTLPTNHGSVPQPHQQPNQLSSYSFAQVTGQPTTVNLPHTPTVLVSPNSIPNNCSPQTPSSIVADEKSQYTLVAKREEQLPQINSQSEIPIVNSISNGDCSKGSAKTFSSDESRTDSFTPIQTDVPNCIDNFANNHNLSSTFANEQLLKKTGESNCGGSKSQVKTLEEPSHRKVVNSVLHLEVSEQNNLISSGNTSGTPARRDRRQSSTNEPIVVLKKLSFEEQILAQKSIKQFNKKSVTKPEAEHVEDNSSNLKKPKTPLKSSESQPKKKSTIPSSSSKKETNYRVFTSKRKEPDKNKVKGSKRSLDPDFNDEANTLADKVKKRRRSNQANYVESPVSGEEDISGNESSDSSLNKMFTSNTNAPVGPVLKKVKKKTRKEIVDNIEDLSESNTFQSFSRIVDSIFDSMEEIDLTVKMDENADCPEEILIPLYQLRELTGEAAKMKMLKVTNQFSIDKLNKLLMILGMNVKDGSRIFPETNQDEDEDEAKMFMELAIDRITRSADAALICMYIMTSASMPEKVFLEDTIDRIVTLAKYQLHNSVYPVFDPAYRVDPKAKDGYSGSIKQKRAHANKSRNKSINQLYNKLHEIVGLLGELLDIQGFTDTIILKMSTLGVSPFFVEGVSELQLCALRLVTSIFASYPKHRQLILEDILASIARLPTSKRSLRNYRLNSEENIQMLTALVLQLIHSVVQLPEVVEKPKPMNILSAMSDRKKGSHEKNEKKPESSVTPDREVLITSSYQDAISTGYRFLTVFLRKCGTKNEDMDYRPLFENFVQDLLSTLNKPEWPATEPLLNLLGGLLVQNFSNRSVDTPIRVASLEYLGVVASRLRKDAVSSQLKKESINEVIQRVIKENLDEDDAPLSSISPKGKKSKLNKMAKCPKKDETQILQKALLNYIDENMGSDPALLFARRFYIAQWYKDSSTEVNCSRTKGNKSKDFEGCSSPPPVSSSSKSKNKHGSNKHKRNASVNASYVENNEVEEEEPETEEDNNSEILNLIEDRKNFLFTLIAPKSGKNSMKKSVDELDYETAELVARFLSSKRSFSKAFDYYLLKILSVLNESTVAVRTKAMKSLSMVVEADPSILARPEMQKGVSRSLLDPSTSVREAVIDLVGKFILIRPELTHQYYDMLTARILDTGVSVRKRVIKILKDVCLEQPDFPKVPEICVKIIRRVNDEEGIKKLVGEVFQSMWFIPVPERDKDRIIQKVKNITHVVAACKDIGLEWFEQLLSNLLKAKEEINVKPVVKACKQIVDCLVENVLTLEESTSDTSASENLAACFTTLNLFTKIQPHLVIRHAVTIQPYLSITSSSQYDCLVAQNAANILQKIVPLLDHPSQDFLAQLEEAVVKLILQHNYHSLLNSCVSCLGTIVNKVSKNFSFVLEVFRKFFVVVLGCRKKILENQNRLPPMHRPALLRSLYTIGLFCVQFDFNLPALDPNKTNDPGRIFEFLHFFTLYNDNEISLKALCGLGLFLQRYFDFMMGPEVKELYQAILTNPNALPQMKCQVLRNMSNYLSAEDARLNQKDSEWSKVGKNEDLKEMDASSGMASTVIQIYLKQVLESVVSKQDMVRQAALKVIQVTLSQGLVHPVQIVPYLICLGSDDDNVIRAKADQLLQDIEKKYPGFVQMKASVGVQMSFKLQQLLRPKMDSLVRGFRMADCPVSRNGFLYSVIRGTRQNRRAFALSILKRFDELSRTSLEEMLYLADNLVYFPFQVQDEPLFIMHHIDVLLSMAGANLLQSFREGLIPIAKTDSHSTNTVKKEPTSICENGLPGERDASAGEMPPPTDPTVPEAQPVTQSAAAEEDDEDDEDFDSILGRLPEDTRNLQECINMSQGFVLLLFVKQTLKDMYGFTDGKLQQYSPNETAKVWEKTLNRRSGVTFKPIAVLEFAQQSLKCEEQEVLDASGREAMVNHYLNFKQLMLLIDPSEDDEDEDAGGVSNSARNSAPSADQLLRTYTGVATAINASRTGGVKKEEDASNKVVNSSDGLVTTPLRDLAVSNKSVKTPATNSRSRSKHKTPKTSSSHKEKVKKKHKKKRRRILDSDDSDSDPDYE